MGIVGGFDVHRAQITVDCIDTESGEVWRGQVRPATRERLREWLEGFSRRQAGCRALQAHFGIGMLTSVAIWAEMGDCRRFSSSDDAVRHTGLDITVWSSDSKRSPGHLSRQGPAVLRWALFEAAKCAYRATSPDHDYHAAVKERQGGNRATLSVARKLARRVHHNLRALGDDAFALPEPARPPATAKTTTAKTATAKTKAA